MRRLYLNWMIFSAIIFCFNTTVLPDVIPEAQSRAVEVRHFNIIYAMIDNLKTELNKQLPLIDREEILGEL